MGIRQALKEETAKEFGLDFLNVLVRDGVAPQDIRITDQEDSRKRALDKIDLAIAGLQHSKDIVQRIQVGTMLFARALVDVNDGKNIHRYVCKKIDVVITPITINKDSLRCILWAQEFSNDATNNMSQSRAQSMILLNFSSIRLFRPWCFEDAPLTINYEYMTPAYRKFAFEGAVTKHTTFLRR